MNIYDKIFIALAIFSIIHLSEYTNLDDINHKNKKNTNFVDNLHNK